MKEILESKSKKIERKLKKVLRGCGGFCEKGGECWHLSRKEHLTFNKSLIDSKLQKIRMYCDGCKIEIFELKAQLILLKELLEKAKK